MLHTIIRSQSLGRAFFLFLLGMVAQSLWASYPLVRNFMKSDYEAGTQNWAIAQDALGRMYFANNYGLLCFDGHNWDVSRLNNHTTVRSLHIDSLNGRVYVGGSDEFGYFYHDSSVGVLRYCSMLAGVEGRHRQFHEVWNIHQQGNVLWFQSDFKVFRSEAGHIQVITSDNKITTSALIDGKIYVGTNEAGLFVVHDRQLVPILQNELLRYKRICAVLPYAPPGGTDSGLLIVTAFDGLFYFDGRTVSPFKTDIDVFLKENQVFSAVTNGRDLVFGTVDNGAVVKNIVTGYNTYINKNTGLQNNTVLSISYDCQDNLWLGLDNGISCVVLGSPVNSLLGGGNLYGAGYTSLLQDGTLFLGTNQGLYALQYPLPSSVTPVQMSPLLKGQVWGIDTIGKTLFVCNDAGLYEREGPSFRKISGIPGAWSVIPLRHNPDYGLVSTYENFFLIKKEKGKWQFVRRIVGYDDSGGRLWEDQSGYLWVGHWMKGLFRLRLSEDMTRFSESHIYNTNKGLPSDYNNSLCMVNDHLTVSTFKGFYKYDEKADSMVSDNRLNAVFGSDEASRLYAAPDRSIWSVSPHHIKVASMDVNGNFTVDSTTYKPLAEKLIAGYEDFNFIEPERLIVSGQDGFYEVDTQCKDTALWNSRVFVNRVYATGRKDSLIYTAGDNIEEVVIELPYALNSLRFEFVMPEYRIAHAARYNCYLENYDKGWNELGTARTKEYTQLHEGEYKFHVKAVNIYTGAISTYTLLVRIAPPWYRDLYAKVAYAVLLILLLVGLFFYLRKVSRRAAQVLAQRKEKEMAELKRHAEEEALRKDLEIASLKSRQLEHDVKYKSQELSNITMNLLRKNEILIDIAEQISKLKEGKEYSLGSSAVKQLDSIHRHIQENISHDDDWQNFSHNFDVVYDDFLKRLLESFPKLTHNDLRLCAYLKMGLSSKDIAPLLNISYRSVEMTRYRLRAKLGLERDVNLMTFLLQF